MQTYISNSNGCASGCTSGCLSFLVGSFIYALPGFLIVMFLWNWLMPDLFGLPQINVFQAFGLLMLNGLLRQSGRDNASGSD